MGEDFIIPKSATEELSEESNFEKILSPEGFVSVCALPIVLVEERVERFPRPNVARSHLRLENASEAAFILPAGNDFVRRSSGRKEPGLVRNVGLSEPPDSPPFRIPTNKPLSNRLFRCPVELSACLDTIQPFQSVIASVVMTSMLSISRHSCGWLLEEIPIVSDSGNGGLEFNQMEIPIISPGVDKC